MTAFYTQDFEAASPPALPSGWLGTGIPVTGTAGPRGGTKDLQFTLGTANTAGMAWYDTADSNAGNVAVSGWVAVPATGGGSGAGVFLGASGLTAGNFGAGTLYSFDLTFGYGGSPLGKFTINRRATGVNGTATLLVAVFPAATITAGAYYQLTLTRSGTAFSGQVVRASDGQYLTAAGAWSATPQTCMAATDSTYTGAGKCGYTFQLGASTAAGNLYADDFSIDPPSSLALAAPVASSVTGAGATLTSPAATGGTAPFAYQLQRGWDFGGVGGNYVDTLSPQAGLGSGVAPSAFTDSSACPGTLYRYRVRVTDSSGTPVVAYSPDATATTTARTARAWYFAAAGDDTTGDGTAGTPYRSAAKASALLLQPGDSVLFRGGDTFAGTFAIPNHGTAALPVAVDAYGTGKALFTVAGGARAIYGLDTDYVSVANLAVTGPGVNGTTGALLSGSGTGFAIDFTSDLSAGTPGWVAVRDCTVAGCYAGIQGYTTAAATPVGWSGVEVGNCTVRDCLLMGIWTQGSKGGLATVPPGQHKNVHIHNCLVYNIFADASLTTLTTNGSGIMVSAAAGGVVEYCVAHHCGARNATATGGPVGIWTVNSTSVRIRWCESYGNSAVSGVDGGGFDIDGACTNCEIAYCYSHDNQGAGYLIGAYTGTTTQSCTIHHNVSYNDAATTGYGAFMAFSAVTGCGIFHNTLVLGPSSHAAAAAAMVWSGTYTGCLLANNVLATQGPAPLKALATVAGLTVAGNLYHAYAGTFAISWNGTSYASLAAFKAGVAQEVGRGVQGDPLLLAPAGGTVADTGRGPNFTLTGFDPQPGSPALDAGAVLTGLATPFEPGPLDFHRQSSAGGAAPDVGAAEYAATPALPPASGGVFNPISGGPIR